MLYLDKPQFRRYKKWCVLPSPIWFQLLRLIDSYHARETARQIVDSLTPPKTPALYPAHSGEVGATQSTGIPPECGRLRGMISLKRSLLSSTAARSSTFPPEAFFDRRTLSRYRRSLSRGYCVVGGKFFALGDKEDDLILIDNLINVKSKENN